MEPVQIDSDEKKYIKLCSLFIGAAFSVRPINTTQKFETVFIGRTLDKAGVYPDTDDCRDEDLSQKLQEDLYRHKDFAWIIGRSA